MSWQFKPDDPPHRPVYRPRAPHPAPRSTRPTAPRRHPNNALAVAGFVGLLLVMALVAGTLIVVNLWGG